MKYIFSLVVPFYALDQLTKLWVSRRLPFESEEIIIPKFFTLVHWGNTGAAFSIMQGYGWFFVVLAAVALLTMSWMAWRGHVKDTLSKVSFSLLAAGILGNVTDRILHGHVIDFLLFYLHVPFANPWPAFNVADSCIFVAAFMLIWQSFRQGNVTEKK
ncbi:MAG TPA: signal peptidase II [Chthoniobacterales bacterium]|jgi:signal peptidase II